MTHKIDRTGWPKGEWDNEPDAETWVDKMTGYECKILRSDVSGAWCGYVGVTEKHPWFGKSYGDDVPVPKNILDRTINLDEVGVINVFLAVLSDKERKPGHMEISCAIDCHGGITFSNKQKASKLWYFGFDCGHCDDYPPAMVATLNSIGSDGALLFGRGTYRNMNYVKLNVTHMAEQLREIEKAHEYAQAMMAD